MPNASSVQQGHCALCGASLSTTPIGRFCPACLLEDASSSVGTETEPLGTASTPGSEDPESDFPLEASEKPPHEFGPYQQFEELGRGGMGVVHRALHAPSRRLVALKVISPDRMLPSEARERFRLGAQLAADLHHPNIVPIFDIGSIDGQEYLSMKLVRGRNLAELTHGNPFSPRRAATCLHAVAAAMHHAHNRGVLHRDLKPSNILLDQQVRPWITDFGLATKLVGDSVAGLDGQFAGTPGFMAPEQAEPDRWREISIQTDVYGLGAVLYHLITGRPPFEGTREERVAKVLLSDPEKPSKINPAVPADLETICLKCLQYERADRYESARALADDLGCFLAGEPISAQPPTLWRSFRRWRRQRPVLSTTVILAGIVLPLLAIGATAAAIRINAANRLANHHLLLQELETTRLLPRFAGWFGQAWEKAQQAAAFPEARQNPGNLVDQATALLYGLDARQLWGLTNSGAFSLAFQPDGKSLLFAGLDFHARTLDCQSLALRDSSPATAGPLLLSQKGSPIQLQYDSSRRALAVVELGTSKIRQEWLTPSPVVSAETGTNEFPLAVLSEDGSSGIAVLEGSGQGESVVAFGPRGLRVLADFPARVTAVAISSDGSLVAAADTFGQIHLWGGERLDPLPPFFNGRNNVLSLTFKKIRFSSDGGSAGQWLLAAGDAGGTVRIWNTSTGALKMIYNSGYCQINALSFSYDGSLICAAGRGPVKLLTVASGRLLLDIQAGDCVGCLAFSPDGQYLAVGTGGKYYPSRVSLWQLIQDRGIKSLPGLSAQVSKVCFSGNGMLAALAHDWTVGIWNVENGQLQWVFEVPKGDTPDNAALAFSPDGSRFAFCAGEGARVWDLHSGNVITNVSLPPGLADSLAFDARGRLLLFRAENRSGKATRSGELPPGWQDPIVCRIRDLLSTEPIRPLAEITEFDRRVHGAVAAPDGARFIVAGLSTSGTTSNALKVFDSTTGAEQWSLPLSGDPCPLAVDPSGRFLYLRDDNRPLALDLATGARLPQNFSETPGAISPDGNFWVTGDDGWVLYRRGPTPACITFRLAPVYDSRFASFNRGGDLLAWGEADGSVTLLNLPRIGTKLAELGFGW